MKRFADTPIWLRLTGAIWLMLVLAWGGMITWETQATRSIAIDQAEDFSHAVNEMTMAGLTGMMITGTVAQRDVFLDQIKELSAVRDLRVLRGEAVSKAYGPGDASDNGALDDVERAALQSGKAHVALDSTPGLGEHLRVVIPALASENYLGKNCLSCHQVGAGTPLGAVSMRISLEKANAAVASFRNKSILFAFIVSLPVMLIVFLFIRRFVIHPLDEMSAGLAELAKGEGDLTRRLKVASEDEIGRTASLFNRMLATVADLVRQVSSSAAEVSTSARDLSAEAQRVARGSRQQNDQSIEAAAAVEALGSNIGNIASSTESVHQLSRESESRSSAGQQSLDHLIAEVDHVGRAVQHMVESVNAFVDSTTAISSMTREVREIAEQTNLLALNAAIEAARAGEQGRGFAVVADEVRKLAEKSARSAGEIDAITATISGQSEAVRSSLDKGLSHLAASRDAAENVSGVLQAAGSSVAEVRNGLDRIAMATEEQRRATETVAGNIEAIAGMARQNDDTVSRTVEAAGQMQHLADRLQESVSRFRV
ncbi:MAG: methyl-accepting chemotaxis protein [Rhodocyclaceae bacterium]|nr:methyl-accepting chemotaxis protein [Rhodocyclaceae bacterium]MCP5231642.1 methyl-accepting chemotaxis protein [Zoogloeaceae bacterium]MCP5240018.1 methyl-accepting chemotaxis protein [Zoogloeaceae bacterium]MCP5253753.1 methyl-accepting chemotaxis protein [Zoogloeaceae bacterium]MCP5293857.1 methyl-accepting chemotaxis protein [Zoogloeaceae bacterium]